MPAVRVMLMLSDREEISRGLAEGLGYKAQRDARATNGSTGLHWCTWRVWWSVQGDHAIALVCDRGLAQRVAVTSCLIDDRSGYPQRSAGVRALAERTLRCFTPARDVLWACSGFGAPVLVADGAQVAVSLTHGDGLLGAAIALQPSWMHRTSQSSGLYSAQSIS